MFENSTTPADQGTPHFAAHWGIATLFSGPEAGMRAARASMRLISLVAELPCDWGASVGWTASVNGVASVWLSARGLSDADVTWLGESTASWARLEDCPAADLNCEDSDAWEVVATPTRHALPAPFPVPHADTISKQTTEVWPQARWSDGTELLSALIHDRSTFIVHLAAASTLERQMLTEALTSAWQTRDPMESAAWAERALRMRAVILTPTGSFAARSRLAIRNLGLGMTFQQVASREAHSLIHGHPSALYGAVVPLQVAQVLLRLPAAADCTHSIGIPVCAPPALPVPISHEDVTPARKDTLRLGCAIDAAGSEVDVRLPIESFTRHLQLMGASGSGKTSALTGIAVHAINAGYGVTVLSPHPDLIERVSGEVGPERAGQVVTIHSADTEAVVPVNALAEEDYGLALETITTVLQDLIDPNFHGMFGLRATRLISLGFAASRALLGSRATLATAAAVFQEQDFVAVIARAIEAKDPATARALRGEAARIGAQEYTELNGWLQSRLHSIIGSRQMRAILGSGHDAVDVAKLMDHRGALLVDLASLSVGLTSAQMLGELWLTKHWNALARRHDTNPHLLVIDECHLFSSGLLPRLLAEGRKFGIGVILAHQHLGQLTRGLRDAVAANASSVMAFRSAPQEAVEIQARLGHWLGEPLPRQSNLECATTLSLPSGQTSPFTLRIDHNANAHNDPEMRQRILARSRQVLAAPYERATVLGLADLAAAARSRAPVSPPEPTLLDDWLRQHGVGPADPQAGHPAR